MAKSPTSLRVARIVIGLVAAGLVVFAAAVWTRPQARLGQRDAVRVAVDSFESVGLDAAVLTTPELGVHEVDGRPDTMAWFVTVRVDGEDLEVRVQHDEGQLVWIDDRTADGGRVLTDVQYSDLTFFRDDTLFERWRRQNAVASVTAIAAAIACAMIGRRIGVLWRTAP